MNGRLRLVGPPSG